MQDRAMIEACRQGDRPACRQLVERHRERAVRAAFLLTGEPASAESLAVNGFHAAFENVLAGRDGDFSSVITSEVARLFLRDRPGERAASDAVFDTSPGAERQRFAVDNERTRVRSALALLDGPARAAVVLRLYCGLADEEVRSVLGRDVASDFDSFQAAGERLCTNLDLDSERDLALALATAAFDAPRPDVWDAIVPEIECHFEREERIRRVVNVVSALIVVIGLLAGVLIVSGALSNDDGESEAAAARSQATPAEVLEAAPLLLPTPTATPRAEVVDLLLALSIGQGPTSARVFHPGRETDQQIVPEGVVETGSPVVAPDGNQVVVLWYEFDGGQAQGYAALFGPDLRQMYWKTSIASVPHDADSAQRPSFMMAAALNHDHIFIARHPWQSGDPVEIEVLERTSGERLETIRTNLPGFVAHDVRLYAPPGHDAVYLFSITRESPAGYGQLEIIFLSYRVPGGEKILGRILHDVPDSRVFFLYGSRLSNDGDYLFGVEHTDVHHEIAVHFFDLARGTVEPRIRLPFQPVADPLPVQQAVSHDGRWLYVLSPSSLEVAVVDLNERRLQGIIPLDSGVLDGSVVDVVYTGDRQMQLSNDARRLYAIGTSTGDDAARPSGVWVIDTSTWTVVQHLAPEIRTAGILLDADGASLFVQEVVSSAGGAQQRLYTLDIASGRIEAIPAPMSGRFALTSLAALYRDLYAATPWIEGRAPMPVPESRPLARARVEIDPQRLEAGEPVTVEIRFVHPLDGSPVEETAADDARFRPPASVRATWQPRDEGDAIIVDLGPAEYGVYRGVARLPDAGRWSLHVDLDWPAGQLIDRTLLMPDAVRVDEVDVPSVGGAFARLALR